MAKEQGGAVGACRKSRFLWKKVGCFFRIQLILYDNFVELLCVDSIKCEISTPWV